jgi:hypothetical protein
MFVIPGEVRDSGPREGDPGIKHTLSSKHLGPGSRSLRSLAGMTGSKA